MKKILLILVVLTTLAGCSTINHGTTVPAGHLEAALIPGFISHVADLRYGATDDLTVGASADFIGFSSVAQAEAFLLYRFSFDSWDFVPGIGARAYLLEREYVPSGSFALSRALGVFRPYAGVLGDTAKVKPYLGLETRFDQFMVFAQIGWQAQFRSLGKKDKDYEGSFPDFGYSESSQRWAPAAGVSWRF